eukprot:scaffold47993_cov56-Phaeocystis_antarctica.AAC.8
MEHWRLERWRSSHAMPCRMRILPASRHMWKAFWKSRHSRQSCGRVHVARGGCRLAREFIRVPKRDYESSGAQFRRSLPTEHSVHKTKG